MLAIPKRRTIKCKEPGLDHSLVVLLRGLNRSWRFEEWIGSKGEAERESDLIAKVFISRTELRLKNKEQNLKFDAGGEERPMKLLSHKIRSVRETWKLSIE